MAWEALCAEARAFATEVGRERLINISVAASGGNAFGLGGLGRHGGVVWNEPIVSDDEST